MIELIAAAALAFAPTTSAPAPVAGTKDDPVYGVAANDPEMNAAIARGRATLPEFYRRLASPGAGEGEFMVKFDIDPSDRAEYVWAIELDRSRAPMTGVLINQPLHTDDREGDRVAIPEDRIIDWGYRSGRVMQGSFTNRVLIERMPAEDAAPFRRFLGW